jgi:uroporphyrin-III C-methyltransferase
MTMTTTCLHQPRQHHHHVLALTLCLLISLIITTPSSPVVMLPVVAAFAHSSQKRSDGQSQLRRAPFAIVTRQQDSKLTALSMASSLKDDDYNMSPPQQKAGNSKSKKQNGGNEWGIPTSSSLPPLGPLPKGNAKAPAILPNGGKVTLLGSGPGDPDLLTVKAYKLLTEINNPDNTLVVVDRLVSPEILNIIASKNIKVARKLPGCAELAQEEIYWWCYQGLNRGMHIIRLKIGDPFVFGRGGEEVLKFRHQFGIEPIVIPGVSAAFSAPLLGSIPVTHRGVANQVVMCTGYGRNGTSPDLIKYHKEQTVVFLMAVGRLQELCQRLIEMAGYPTDTPVAIIEAAGCPNQRTVVGNMLTIADIAKRYNVQPPSTIVVGDVVNVLLDNDEESGQHITGLIQNYTASIY